MLAVIVGLVMIGATGAKAVVLEGRVVAIADGDTLTILESSNPLIKIRLAGIDAPEQAQAFGQKSKESLSELVFGKTVKVETNKKDRYGRTIGKILVDNQDVNLVQIKRGLAWHYKVYAKEQSKEDASAYGEAENIARTARIGVWGDVQPVSPWVFRHGK